MYRYLNICANEHYDGYINPGEALRHVHAVETLKQKSPAQFEFSEGGHWFLVLLLNCNGQGGYASDGLLPEGINLIEVISGTESEKASKFAQIVAERLGWLVVDVTNE